MMVILSWCVAQAVLPPQGGERSNLMPAPLGRDAAVVSAKRASVDQYDQKSALLDDVETTASLSTNAPPRGGNATIDARRTMSDDPEGAGQQLKLTLQNVEGSGVESGHA